VPDKVSRHSYVNFPKSTSAVSDNKRTLSAYPTALSDVNPLEQEPTNLGSATNDEKQLSGGASENQRTSNGTNHNEVVIAPQSPSAVDRRPVAALRSSGQLRSRGWLARCLWH